MTRTEYFEIEFVGGRADGWVFGVTEPFRDQLDIKYSELVDRKKSHKLREQKLKNDDGSLPTVYRKAWTQGMQPLFSFDIGHVFYDPPSARGMVWADALGVLRREVQVTEARYDELPGSGWVKVRVRYFDDGKVVETMNRNMSQGEFVTLLRTGYLPAGQEPDLELVAPMPQMSEIVVL
jgi:hypothetical protein